MSKSFWLRALAVALTLSLLWGISEYQRAEELKIVTENQYRRSFSDFVSHLDGLETNLSKSIAAGTPTQQIFFLSQSWQQSETAVKNLSHLPAEQIGISYLDRFLNQVGEFTRHLSMQITKGEGMDSSQEITLGDMHKRLIEVNNSVQELYVAMTTENIPWVEKGNGQAIWPSSTRVSPAAAQGDEGQPAKPGSVGTGLEQLNATLQKFPPFSYSGQSDVHSVPEPLGLPKGFVSQDEARSVALDYLHTIGYPNANPQFVGNANGPLSGYIWKYENTSLDICKMGGVVTLFRDEREIGMEELDIDQAAAEAMKTLRLLGWRDLVKTSTEDFGSYIQLEAVNQVNNIRIYPDKIRMTVAKDNGQITGFDATPYWLFNHDRSYETKISLQQAQHKLRPNMTVKETRLAVIPLPGWQEALCYEFRAGMKDEEYLIYINAVTGIEEKIQRIIRTPRGEFLQ